MPVAGDLIIDKLGLSEEDRKMVVEECDIVINCAASVNFDDPLLDALQINYYGCLRMLELAKECKKLLSFCHVSTAYTNSNSKGNVFIEEKIYDAEGGADPEDVVERIVSMGPQKVQEEEAKLLGAYPNTYTFTKSLAEKAIKKLHGELPTTILRPSIIISCYDQPVQGWTDTLSAGGGITYTIQVGLLHWVKARIDAIADLIPCDFVVNLLIA